MDAPVAEAVIGHNRASPFDLSTEEIDGLYDDIQYADVP